MNSIFSNIKVLDITKVYSGPFCTRLLADYGAQVIKIESVQHPDDARSYPPLINGESGYFEMLNRNKQGVSLDLNTEPDRGRFYDLCRDADVLIENLSPRSKHKLKINYEVLQQINPKLIYASLSGIGQESSRKYYDVIAQAESGLMSLSGVDSVPMKIGPAVVDAFSGMTLAFAVSSALFHRERTGLGQYLDVSMLGCALHLLEANVTEYSIRRSDPNPPGNQDAAIAPFGVFACKGGFFVLAAGSQQQWEKLKGFLLEHYQFDGGKFEDNSLRLSNIEELTAIIEHVFAAYTSKEAVAVLTSLDIPACCVRTMSGVCSDTSLFTKEYLLNIRTENLGECVVPGYPVKFSGAEHAPIRNAPKLGQDNKRYGV